jgi:hypothetical protein
MLQDNPTPWRNDDPSTSVIAPELREYADIFSEDIPMPNWLIAVCALSVCVAAAYLLYVILKPEDF